MACAHAGRTTRLEGASTAREKESEHPQNDVMLQNAKRPRLDESR
jgi:hypothetical protein